MFRANFGKGHRERGSEKEKKSIFANEEEEWGLLTDNINFSRKRNTVSPSLLASTKKIYVHFV